METDLTTYLNRHVQCHAPWHDLIHAWLGRSYSPEFYNPVRNSKIRDSLQKIAIETEEDYCNIEKILQQAGVHVQRPEIDSTQSIMDYVENNTGKLDYDISQSFTLIPKPPMQPRDCQLIVGNTYMSTNREVSWFQPLLETLHIQQRIESPFEFDAPLVTVIGDCIVVDCREHPALHEFFVRAFPDYKIVPVFIGGHNDAVFCPVRPGLIVSTYHHSNYEKTFPGWQVKYIENQSWNAIPGWRKYKHNNQHKWWIPDRETNPEFENFVDTWLDHWLGFVGETVFDVNMLQINANTVLVNNYNKDMFEFFKQHNIEAIVAPFRHRFFWDGGIHCITGDIYRQGEREQYILPVW